MTIERVFVAGAGLMGHGIAQVHAAIGLPVALYEPDLARAEAGRDRIAGNAKPTLLNELARTGKSFTQDWPWQVSEGSISKSNRAILRHAETFREARRLTSRGPRAAREGEVELLRTPGVPL